MTQRVIKQLAKRVLPPSLVRSIRRTRPGRSGGAGAAAGLVGAAARPDIGHLEDRLWLGYHSAARGRLSEIATDPQVEDSTRARAGLALSRWLVARGEFEPALTHLDGLSTDWGPLEVEATSLYADCLNHLGRPAEALSRLAPLIHRQTVDASTMLRLGSTRYLVHSDRGHGSGPLIESLNRLYARRHLVQLRRGDVSQSAGPTNVTALAPPYEPAESAALVSVIVPVTADEDRLVVALRSLTAQSWTNLEVVLVGEAERQQGDEVRRLVEADSRVRWVDVPGDGDRPRLQNVGLGEANGEFIAVHRAGEWSHPQRIELLASALGSDPHLQATGTFVTELTEDRLVRPADPRHGSSLLARNLSSVMLRRSATEELGGWDEAPMGSDEEYIERITARFGSHAVEWLEPDTPMSIVAPMPHEKAADEDALSPAWHYRAGFRWWHSTPDFASQLPYRPGQGTRPFPSGNEAEPANEATDLVYDVVVAGDLTGTDPHHTQAVRWIEQHPDKVGVLHIPPFDGRSGPAASEIQALSASGKVTLLGKAPIRCDSVVLLSSFLASPLFDGLPEIVCNRAHAVAPSPAPDAPTAARPEQLEEWLGLPVAMGDDLGAALAGAPA